MVSCLFARISNKDVGLTKALHGFPLRFFSLGLALNPIDLACFPKVLEGFPIEICWFSQGFGNCSNQNIGFSLTLKGNPIEILAFLRCCNVF